MGKNLIIKLCKKFKKIGFVNTFHELLIKIINKIIFFKIYRCMVLTMETVNPQFLEIEKGYDCRFIEIEDLKCISSDELDLSIDFIQKAIEKKNYCYGIFKNNEIASYGWYSNTPTAVTDDLELKFKSNFIYQFKGFTHPRFRGKRLHAIGMAKALQTLSGSEIKGLVAVVESTNFNSRRSVYRMGYLDFGVIIVLRIRKRYRCISIGDCSKYGFSIHSNSSI